LGMWLVGKSREKGENQKQNIQRHKLHKKAKDNDEEQISPVMLLHGPLRNYSFHFEEDPPGLCN